MTKTLEGPDQARSWAIAFAACAINTLLSGVNRVNGLFYVALIEKYGVSRLQANMPFTLRNVVRNLGGLITGAIGQTHGPRNITIAGGILASLGMVLCFFAPNIIWITVLWGGIHGFGIALGNTLFQVTVNQYFVKYQATASGISLSGACVGSFVFPVVLEYLLDNFGLSGTFLLTGGFLLNVLPAAIVMKEPPWIRKQVKTRKGNDKTSISPGKEQVKSVELAASTIPVVLNVTTKDSKLLSEVNTKIIPSPDLLVCDSWNKEKCRNEGTCKISGIPTENGIDNPSFIATEADLGKTISFQKPRNVPVTKRTMRTLSMGEISVAFPSAHAENRLETSLYQGILKVCRNPMFHVISLSLVTLNLQFDITVTVIIDYATDKGVKEDVAKYFIMMMSLGDLLGRMSIGWVIDKKCLTLPRFMMLLQVAQGVCFLLIPLFNTFNVLTVLIIMYGVTSGATLVILPVAVGQYLMSVQSLAIGCIPFFSGVVSFAVPPVIGYFRDQVGSYDGVFYIAGGLSIVTGVLWLLEPLILVLSSSFDKAHNIEIVAVKS